MKRRPYLKTLALAAACAAILAVAGASPVAAETPSGNIVIIHVDDLGWRDLGCMGSPVYETPHIDALAKSGTLYNLKEDIGESKDLSKSRPEILKRMLLEFEASYERFGAVKTLPPNPGYVPDA